MICNRIIRIAATLLVCGECCAVSLADGKTYYVRQGGSDVSDGLTPDTALRSIQRAVSRCTGEGNSVIVGPGVYYEQVYIGSGAGSAAGNGSVDTPNLIVADSTGVETGDAAASVVIHGDGVRECGIMLRDRDDWVIAGLEFHGQTQRAIDIEQCDGIEIESCIIEAPRTTGIRAKDCDRLHIDGNTFSRNDDSGSCILVQAVNRKESDHDSERRDDHDRYDEGRDHGRADKNGDKKGADKKDDAKEDTKNNDKKNDKQDNEKDDKEKKSNQKSDSKDDSKSDKKDSKSDNDRGEREKDDHKTDRQDKKYDSDRHRDNRGDDRHNNDRGRGKAWGRYEHRRSTPGITVVIERNRFAMTGNAYLSSDFGRGGHGRRDHHDDEIYGIRAEVRGNGAVVHIINNVGSDCWAGISVQLRGDRAMGVIANNSLAGCRAGIEADAGDGSLRIADNIVAHSRFAIAAQGHDRDVAISGLLTFDIGGSVALGSGGPRSIDGYFQNIDPMWVAPSTGNFALQPGSPAIDAALGVAEVGSDIRGLQRPWDGDGDGNARADLGAYEYHPDEEQNHRLRLVQWREIEPQ